ncbi:hypothetical protein E4U17_003235 [Claviceps sp. LM77 group G4]|nr:hypothetical protein E4U17_003235 [Claviceps sp. LM77 group G4]KAG6072303.1 hypothetical protein E4U33_003296 [Claviceps sp. LM78 group G4]KAG6084508.1 hypothetical protein E4U16_001637 [Claviceps sp. LM84 group G4]
MPVNPAFLGTATAFSGSLDVFCVQSHHQTNMSSNNNFSFFEAQPDQFAAVTTPEMEIAFMASTTPAEAHTMGDGSPLSGYFTNSSTGSRNYYVNWRKQRSLSPGASGSTHAPHVSQCTPTGSSDSSSNLVDPALRHEATADWAADLLHTDAFGPHPMLSSQDLDKVLAERGIQSFSHQDMQTFSLQDMSLQDVQSMSLQEIQTMLYPDMQPLSHQDIQSLSPHDIQSLSPHDIQSLSPHDIQSLSPQDVPSSSHQEIQSLSNLNQDIETLSDHHQDAHRRSISFQDVQAMSHHIESLSNQNAQSMPHQDVPSMSHHIDSLPNQNHDERRRSISYEDIQSMSPQAIQAMSNQEMQSISLQAIQSMSNQDTTIAY